VVGYVRGPIVEVDFRALMGPLRIHSIFPVLRPGWLPPMLRQLLSDTRTITLRPGANAPCWSPKSIASSATASSSRCWASARREHQPGPVHCVVVIECHRHAVETVRISHRKDALLERVDGR
jgi:hypothetical protein